MVVFSNEWAEGLKTQINENEAYKAAAAQWNDTLLLVLSKSKTVNHADNPAIFLDLQHGTCMDARIATAEDFEDATFILGADTENWKRMLDGKIAPMSAVMRGKLKVLKGGMSTLLISNFYKKTIHYF